MLILNSDFTVSHPCPKASCCLLGKYWILYTACKACHPPVLSSLGSPTSLILFPRFPGLSSPELWSPSLSVHVPSPVCLLSVICISIYRPISFALSHWHHLHISKFVSGAQRMLYPQCFRHRIKGNLEETVKTKEKSLDKVWTLRIGFGVEQAVVGTKLSWELA